MSDTATPTNITPTDSNEVVSLFADRDHFEAAVTELLASGFKRTDLSVLASHESLEAAGKPATPLADVVTALVGELKYEVPLVASGAIVLAGGVVAAAIAGVIGAAVGGIVAKDILDEVTAIPHTEDFARALDAGSVILWVMVENEAGEEKARSILGKNGGSNTHSYKS